jgi:septum formation protein
MRLMRLLLRRNDGWSGDDGLMTTRLVLASASPRRLELLAQLGLDPIVRPADIDESVLPDEDPVDYVERLAVEKVRAVELGVGESAIGADTTVDVDGLILGKPESADDARRMLRLLSGRVHQVHTGVALRNGQRISVASSTSAVQMVDLSPAAIEWYIDLGEPFGKAGAYAIQGAGGAFVERVVGSVSGIIGLPLALVVSLGHRVGVDLIPS